VAYIQRGKSTCFFSFILFYPFYPLLSSFILFYPLYPLYPPTSLLERLLDAQRVQRHEEGACELVGDARDDGARGERRGEGDGFAQRDRRDAEEHDLRIDDEPVDRIERVVRAECGRGLDVREARAEEREAVNGSSDCKDRDVDEAGRIVVVVHKQVLSRRVESQSSYLWEEEERWSVDFWFLALWTINLVPCVVSVVNK